MSESWADLQRAARLIEVNSLPSYWINGIAKVEVFGPIMRITNYEFRRYAGELVKMPVIEIIRPTDADIVTEFKELLRLALTDQAEGALH